MKRGVSGVRAFVRWAIVFLLVSSLPAAARADAYEWGGAIDGLAVHVVLFGFREGAGETGWTEDDARRFALRAREIVALTGPGVRLEETVEDDLGLILVRGAQRTPLGIHDFDGSDSAWDAALNAVRALGVHVPHALRNPRRVIFTIELTSDATAAVEEPPGQLFFEACLPCTASRPVHTLGSARRVVGVFADRSAARRALLWLRERGASGRVRPL